MLLQVGVQQLMGGRCITGAQQIVGLLDRRCLGGAHEEYAQ
jgi:hypothetical protein